MSEYPTKSELRKIEEWNYTNLRGLIDYIENIWWTPSFGFKLRETLFFIYLELHTGGWSGNEDIINSLKKTMFWFIAWQKSERGGHYYFEVEKINIDKFLKGKPLTKKQIAKLMPKKIKGGR